MVVGCINQGNSHVILTKEAEILFHHMTHNPNRLAGLPIPDRYNDIILSGLPAQKINRVVFFVGFGVEGGDEHVGAVVDADDGLAFVVAEVEAVDPNVFALSDDGSYHELFQVDGAFA